VDVMAFAPRVLLLVIDLRHKPAVTLHQFVRGHLFGLKYQVEQSAFIPETVVEQAAFPPQSLQQMRSRKRGEDGDLRFEQLAILDKVPQFFKNSRAIAVVADDEAAVDGHSVGLNP